MAGTRSDPLVIVVELARWRFPGGNVGGGAPCIRIGVQEDNFVFDHFLQFSE